MSDAPVVTEAHRERARKWFFSGHTNLLEAIAVEFAAGEAPLRAEIERLRGESARQHALREALTYLQEAWCLNHCIVTPDKHNSTCIDTRAVLAAQVAPTPPQTAAPVAESAKEQIKRARGIAADADAGLMIAQAIADEAEKARLAAHARNSEWGRSAVELCADEIRASMDTEKGSE